MAGEDRSAAGPVALLERLRDEPYRFHFYEALRRLECAFPGKPRLGRSLRATDDPVRLGQEPSLTFAPATLSSFQPGEGTAPPRLQVNFFGLFGPNGPLPLHLTEFVRDRIRNHDDDALARFVDLFHHRLLSFFYRAWADARPTVNRDRPQADRFALYVGSLFGMGTPGLADRDALPDTARLHFAGHLGTQTRHAEGLEAMIGEFFGVPARVEEFVGHWEDLPEEARCRLGTSATAALGRTLTLGERFYSCGKFRVALGPLRYAEYERLLPGSQSLRRLVALVRSYIGDEIRWDVNLILRKEDVPPLRLGRAGRLDWTSWLTGRTPDRDASGLLMEPVP